MVYKISVEEFDGMMWELCKDDQEYQLNYKVFYEAYEEKDVLKMESAANVMKNRISELAYNKAFADGINFILKAYNSNVTA